MPGELLVVLVIKYDKKKSSCGILVRPTPVVCVCVC